MEHSTNFLICNRHDITETLLKVVLNTITVTLPLIGNMIEIPQHHDTTEIVLKVALNTITVNLPLICNIMEIPQKLYS